MFYEFIKFLIYSSLIVLISKYILVFVIRKLAENLHLKPKTVGNIAGYATSIPELLTIVTSSTKGLIGASIYNILSSNVINFIQYIASIYINKNNRVLKNKAIRIDIILVIITIIIPIVLIIAKISIDINIVPIFILLYILFIYIKIIYIAYSIIFSCNFWSNIFIFSNYCTSHIIEIPSSTICYIIKIYIKSCKVHRSK